ncbi:MAG TPA: 16S rRNA (guanine(527)-N(7))-methyltransferase RsmG [Stellaceae bacterium]|nr:16S rRNA (guanine(527)-N(7))-methyltransferase RsmG [Stellaceae bacterium]
MILGRDGFAKRIVVSRETLDRLTLYVELLIAWNRRINLVGANTIGDVWRRHILDSAQLFALIPPKARSLIDLGSGAGLPGLVLALMGVPEVHLVEADLRKAAFLREAARRTGAAVEIHAQRMEKINPFMVDIVTARALAPLSALLGMAGKFSHSRTICLFPKGANVEDELISAAKDWKMQVEHVPSLSDPKAKILRLETQPS